MSTPPIAFSAMSRPDAPRSNFATLRRNTAQFGSPGCGALLGMMNFGPAVYPPVSDGNDDSATPIMDAAMCPLHPSDERIEPAPVKGSPVRALPKESSWVFSDFSPVQRDKDRRQNIVAVSISHDMCDGMDEVDDDVVDSRSRFDDLDMSKHTTATDVEWDFIASPAKKLTPTSRQRDDK